MYRIICFFIGHRDTPDSVYPELLQAVEKHITEYGTTEFIVGRYGNFDSLASRAVREAKQKHPEILLTMLLPYHPSEKTALLPQGFDGSWYPPKMETVPKRAAIACANRCAVDHAQYLISYVRYPASNAWNLLQYAQKKIPVTEL